MGGSQLHGRYKFIRAPTLGELIHHNHISPSSSSPLIVYPTNSFLQVLHAPHASLPVICHDVSGEVENIIGLATGLFLNHNWVMIKKLKLIHSQRECARKMGSWWESDGNPGISTPLIVCVCTVFVFVGVLPLLYTNLCACFQYYLQCCTVSFSGWFRLLFQSNILSPSLKWQKAANRGQQLPSH